MRKLIILSVVGFCGSAHADVCGDTRALSGSAARQYVLYGQIADRQALVSAFSYRVQHCGELVGDLRPILQRADDARARFERRQADRAAHDDAVMPPYIGGVTTCFNLTEGMLTCVD